MRDGKQPTPPPKVRSGDLLITQSHPFLASSHVPAKATETIVNAINRMAGVGEHAEREYQRALDMLRPDGEATFVHLSALYKELPDDRYLDRWGLVQLANDLKDPRSLFFLDEVLSVPLPAEKSKNPAMYSTVGEELLIRATGVEAVARLAAKGDDNARELLLKLARHENYSIRRAAIQGFLESGGKNARAVLQKSITKEDYALLEIKRLPASEAARLKPGDFPSRKERNELPPLRDKK